MNKRILYFGLIAAVISALSFISCSPDYETDFEVKTLEVKTRDLAMIKFDISGGTKEIPVITNLSVGDWNASANAEWCKVEKQSEKIIVSAGSSDQFRARTAVVTIAYGHQSYEINVQQSGEQPVLLIDGEREGVVKTAVADGGEFEVNVNSNLNLDYVNISDMASSWIELVGVDDRGGIKVLNFKVKPNYVNTSRETVITLQSSQNHLYTSSFIVEQEKRVWGDLVQIPVELRLDMLSANATQAGDGQGLPGLIDNDINTFYHTLWSGASPGGKHHYVQINLDEPLAFIAIEYHGRSGGNQPGDVKRAGIWVSETGVDNDSEWIKAATVTYDMNNPVNTRYKMNEQIAYLGGAYKYIRFTPEARRNADPIDPSGSVGWWNMADMFVYTFDLEL